jgi:3-oxoacyl-[acyl-carrier protein] reductase
MDLKLKNKVVVITGGTGGIGKQIVKDFLLEKTIVICLIRSSLKMDNLRTELNNQNIDDTNLFSYTCNLLNYEDMKSAIKVILSNHHYINVLVNCAGSANENPFGLIDDKTIDLMIDLNLKSPMMLSHLVLKPMFKQKGGAIINISSASTVKKGRGIVAYASAKAGLETFTRTLAQEVGRKKIRVNTVRPGVIKTGMSSAVIDRHLDTIKKTNSLCRFGEVEEISKAVLFLASDETASYITGECLTIDGGIY